MKPDEIIKALECCLKTNQAYKCMECHYYKKTVNCLRSLMTDTVDLLNRQKADIERLNNITAQADDFARSICDIRILKGKAIADSTDLLTYIEDEKRKAIEDFAERLKSLFDTDYHLDRYYRKTIDDVTKEMVGESNDT